ncbi:MAG TPA: glycosyltransferase family 4 protein [Bryobacteraceae bacterium]|nr:glycosyltransferase family 4 protein [Bryobacteraceae bacterium]
MRILLTATASYVPPRGGATRSNLVWLDQLGGAGHECRIVCGALAEDEEKRRQLQEEEIAARPAAAEEGIEVLTRGPIVVYAVEDPARRIRVLRRQIREFGPDWVLVSSEDLGHALLREAHAASAGHVVYLAHTPQFFPFGAASWNPDRQTAEVAAQSAGVVAIGRHMGEYIERSLGRPAAVIHPPIYGRGPFRNYGNFERGLITMINPCAVKGISIYLDVARQLPQYEFGAVPGWGTTSADRRALAQVSNVRLLANTRDIDEVLAGTRILLMPSLWYEGFGLIVMEAMLRGIPVVSSDSGGLREAKRGTGYVIPVRPMDRFLPEFDERGMPRPEMVENDAGPWVATLRELLSDREAYDRESAVSRKVAHEFIAGLDARAMERFLSTLVAPNPAARSAQGTIESLTPERRALLLERLRKRRMAQ